MRNLRFTQPRSVIFKRQLGLRIIQLEFPQTVSIREFAELPQLIRSQRRSQRIFNFEKCHGGSIAASRGALCPADIGCQPLIDIL